MSESRHMKPYSILFAAALLLGILAASPGCRTSSAQGITPVQLDEMKAAPDVVVIDVREPAELGQLPTVDGARNIPLGKLASQLNGLDKDKRYVLVCRSGNRSRKAAKIMQKNGFEKIYNLKGGMKAYSQYRKKH